MHRAEREHLMLTVKRLLIALCLLSAPLWAQYYTLQPTSNGFQWVPPSGPSVCKYTAVSIMSTSQPLRAGQFLTMYPDKYPDRTTWGNKQLDRLGSWGFNAAGYASDSSVYKGKSVMNEQAFAPSGTAV